MVCHTNRKFFLIFTKTLFFPYKTAYFFSNLNKMQIAKLYYSSKYWQYSKTKNKYHKPKTREEVGVNLANKYQVTSHSQAIFHLFFFCFAAFFLRLRWCLNMSTIFFSISGFSFFEDFFNTAKVQIRHKNWY